MNRRETISIKELEARTRPELIDIDELASILRVPKGTIYNWVYRRKIPFVKVGRLVRFDLKEITQYLDGCRISPLAGKG